MNIAALIRSLIISAIVAFIGSIVHHSWEHGSLDLLTAVKHYSLVFQFAVAIFVGHLLIRAGNRLGTPKGNSELGTVKWFNVKKGYGFITRDQGDDVFVHFRNIRGTGRRSIADGQRVEFTVVDGDKGLQADDVHSV